ncbi:MAG: hypothetical protein U1E86_28425 [Burkholderiaceae bacterium]
MHQTASVDVAIPGTGAIDVAVTDDNGDPIAAKATIVGFDPSPAFNNTQTILGLMQPHRCVAQHRRGRPGRSAWRRCCSSVRRRVGSRRPRAGLVPGGRRTDLGALDRDRERDGNAGATTPVTLQVARVTDSTGFIGAEYHVHSIDSPDSKVTKVERVVSMLAEGGVDFFTPSDHESRQNFNPTIASLGASGLILGRDQRDHDLRLRPLQRVADGTIDLEQGERRQRRSRWRRARRAGLPVVRQLQPDAGADHRRGARRSGPGHGPDQPHPQLLRHGRQLRPRDRHRSGAAVGGAAVGSPPRSVGDELLHDTFDALEIWIESTRSGLATDSAATSATTSNLLNQGILRTAVADSDTHKRITTQSGGPRTMRVASPTDDPGALGGIG